MLVSQVEWVFVRMSYYERLSLIPEILSGFLYHHPITPYPMHSHHNIIYNDLMHSAVSTRTSTMFIDHSMSQFVNKANIISLYRSYAEIFYYDNSNELTYFLPQYVNSFFPWSVYHSRMEFFSVDERTLIHHYHLKSIIYIKVYCSVFWVLVLSEF